MNIGFKLKKLREEQEISQENLAYQLGISQSKLCDIENGRRKKEIDFLLMNKICKTFNKDLHYFMEKEISTDYTKTDDKVLDNDSNLNKYPFNILEQVSQLINDTLAKDRLIKNLEDRLSIQNKK